MTNAVSNDVSTNTPPFERVDAQLSSYFSPKMRSSSDLAVLEKCWEIVRGPTTHGCYCEIVFRTHSGESTRFNIDTRTYAQCMKIWVECD